MLQTIKTLKDNYRFLQPGPYFYHKIQSFTHPDNFGVIWSRSDEISSSGRRVYPYNASTWGTEAQPLYNTLSATKLVHFINT